MIKHLWHWLSGVKHLLGQQLLNLILIILRVLTVQPSHHHFRLMIMVDKRIHTIDNKNRREMVSRPTRSYLVQSARSIPSPLTRLPSGALRSAGELRWRDGWMGMECWYRHICTPYGLNAAAAARITAVWSNLWPHISYSSSRQGDVMRRCNTWIVYAFCWLWHTDFLSRRVA